MRRRSLLAAAIPFSASARAQSGLWPEWLGSYAGAVRFYRSIPLEDIYPPPAIPRVDADDLTPFAVYFILRTEDGGVTMWLRIDGGPMQTASDGETLRFGPVMAGVAKLVSAQAERFANRWIDFELMFLGQSSTQVIGGNLVGVHGNHLRSRIGLDVVRCVTLEQAAHNH